MFLRVFGHQLSIPGVKFVVSLALLGELKKKIVFSVQKIHFSMVYGKNGEGVLDWRQKIISATFIGAISYLTEDFNCATSHLRDIPFARLLRCAIFQLRDIPSARHPSCATTHFRDFSTARHPVCFEYQFIRSILR